MSKNTRIGIVAALVLVVGLVLATKHAQRGKSGDTCCPAVAALTAAAETNTSHTVAATDPKKLPRLLDLGADKCIPCKMMAPILAEFKRDYAGQFTTEFIDVWKNPSAGKQYGVEMIPTQIFFDAEGKALFPTPGVSARKLSWPSGRNWAWTLAAADETKLPLEEIAKACKLGECN